VKALLLFLILSHSVTPLQGPLLQKVRRFTWHEGCPLSPEELSAVRVPYWNFAGLRAEGLLIVNRNLAKEVAEIFDDLFRHHFAIERIEPVEEFGGSDERSMAANNTSAFNCRDITGQRGKFSNHSWGRAIDINPLTNPYVKGDRVLPEGGRAYLDRTVAHPGSILAGSFTVRLFERHGWTWGGSWPDRQDYQHFEKK